MDAATFEEELNELRDKYVEVLYELQHEFINAKFEYIVEALDDMLHDTFKERTRVTTVKDINEEFKKILEKK